ncbi:MAG: Carbohydrate-binding CenC domain protein, partial [candidate division WWE3 bacterium GW2011_GWC1_41_7]
MKVTNVTSKKAALLVLTLFASFFILSQVAKKVDAQESVISQRPIYTDDVAQGWENWSWKSSVNFKNSNPTRTGEKSINYTSGAWGGLYFHNEQIRNIDGYKTFRFFLYPTKSGQDFRVLFFDKYNKKLNTEFTVSEYTDGLAPNKWTKVDIPLDKLKTETKEIKGVAIQEGKGINDSAIFIDDISFETQTETAPVSNSNSSTDSASNNYLIFENSLNSKWSDWSWGGRSSFTDLIEFKQTALWAAFYVHTKEQMDVSGYSTVNFSLKTEKTGNNYKIALFGADDMSFAEFKSLDKMGGQPGSTWKNYSIKISELNPSMRPIKGIAIHNGSEHTNISLFIDNISISGGTYFTLENQDSTTQPEPDKLPAPQQPTPDQAPASSEGTYKASKNVI